jgi:hypothetical protein
MAAEVDVVLAEAHLARLPRKPAPAQRLPELEEALARARAAFVAAVGQSPRSLVYAFWLVRVELVALRDRMALGHARWEDAGAVVAPLDPFRASPPEQDPRLDEVAARAHETRALLLSRLGRDAAAEIESGVRRAERAVAIAPGFAAGHAALGRLRLLQARTTQDQARRQQLAHGATRALAEAVRHNPLLARSEAHWIEEGKRLAESP